MNIYSFKITKDSKYQICISEISNVKPVKTAN